MATFLARMVIPRSRSRGLESSRVSWATWLSRKLPLWRRRASTSVVLPWSTWAMMATFRMSLRTWFMWRNSQSTARHERRDSKFEYSDGPPRRLQRNSAATFPVPGVQKADDTPAEVAGTPGARLPRPAPEGAVRYAGPRDSTTLAAAKGLWRTWDRRRLD